MEEEKPKPSGQPGMDGEEPSDNNSGAPEEDAPVKRPRFRGGPDDPDEYSLAVICKTLEKYLEGKEPIEPDGRRMDIVMGLPCAGKSALIENTIGKITGGVVLDPDRAKRLLPEYINEGGIWVGALHKESVDIMFGGVLKMALEGADDVIIEIIGVNLQLLRKIIILGKSAGYRVFLHHIDISPEESIKRVIARFRETGWFVDPEYIRGIYEKGRSAPKEIFDLLIKNESLN
ncbi:MAG: zeta toxin family protein [Nitrospinota bacterium]|nr:zeta toxin family protein [Nitrospinota bacterium]